MGLCIGISSSLCRKHAKKAEFLYAIAMLIKMLHPNKKIFFSLPAYGILINVHFNSAY